MSKDDAPDFGKVGALGPRLQVRAKGFIGQPKLLLTMEKGDLCLLKKDELETRLPQNRSTHINLTAP